MLEIISKFIIGFITHILDCYVFTKIEGRRFKVDIKMVGVITILNLMVCCIDKYYGLPIRFLIVNANTLILLKVLSMI